MIREYHSRTNLPFPHPVKSQQKYVGRLKELRRLHRRHSAFWVGLYPTFRTLTVTHQ
ncbi:hypothetical protein [Nostoc sp.]|uniref:hypothetical protein n=1 Tax=Nostoc sp. TaxID=1180 RepID=UPI002FF19935